MRGLKGLIPYQEESIGSLKLRKILSISLIVGLLQAFSWTYQIAEAPKANAATTYAPAAATSITIPSGVSSITFTMFGGGGGNGGLDCGAGCTLKTAGARGKVTGTFTVVAGDVVGIFPGYAGTSGTGSTNGGGGAGGADTYASGNYNGGNGGNAGSSGSSGGGGGGGAASILTKNSSVWAVAGGASGAGGNANLANSGQNGNNDNSSSTGTTNGGNGVQTLNTTNNGSGKPCTIATNDGGGGGGGGGGVNGGSGGNLTNAGSGECSGLAGYRGGNSLNAAITSTTNGTDASANTSNGAIEITMQLSTPSSITTSGSIQTFTVSWASAAAAQSFSLKIYNAAGNSLLQTVSVASGTYTKTITNTDFSSIASGTSYQISVTAIGNSEAPYKDSAESEKVSVTTSTPSDMDSAISLNGSSQYASSPDNDAFDIATTLTLAAWVNPTQSNTNMTVAGKAGAYLLQSNGGFWRYCIQGTAAPTTYVCVSTQIPVVTGQWQHVAFTRAANVVNFYLNGYLAFSGSADGAASGSIANSAEPFQVGRFLAQAYFAGLIDEVKLWNVARTQAQVQNDLKTYGGSLSDGLVAYYDFNELVGTSVVNRSTSGSSTLDLISVGAPTITSTSIVETTTVQAYTVVEFMRTFLVASGGWTSPATPKRLQYLVVGGGGGGGVNVGQGGGGGGSYKVTNTTLISSAIINVTVGVGGIGGLPAFNGTARMDGQAGESSTVTVNATTYIGGGGSGGQTYDVANVCPATAQNTSVTPSGGTFLGSGGVGANGGAGGTPSATQATANGKTGYIDSITGTAQFYGAGGGAGFWATRTVAGIGANSIGGNGGNANDVVGSNATKNTGSGGGAGAVGCNSTGGNGGSGIVVIRYITNDPSITTQPTNDTTTVGTVDTFTITTTTLPTPLTKLVNWQVATDTTTAAASVSWQSVTLGTGLNTDTYTTQTLTIGMNKYRYRAIVTFTDIDSLTVIETTTVVTLTVNPAITITSDTSTITRKYGAAQTTPRTLIYSGGTTSSGAVGTSTSHTVRGAFGTLASGKIVLDTSTSTVVFRVDTGTAVGTYVETITVTDFKGATATYAQTVVVTPADTLTVQAETPTATTYTGLQAIFSETITVTGLVAGDAGSGVTYNYSASAAACADGGLCSVGEIGPSGGYVFYVSPDVINTASGISAGGIYLEAAPVGAQGTAEYGCTGTPTPGTSYAVGSGAANTLAIINNCATAGIAARVTSNLTYAGFSDWFMPSLDEMTAIYNNLYNRTPSLGGFTGIDYGSSSQGTSGAGYQAYWWFGAGAASGQTNKNYVAAYRPVRAFNPIYTSSINYGPSTTKPTNAGTYTITPSALVLANNVATSNYVWVDYRTSTFTINKARQDTLTVSSVLGVYETGTVTMKITTLGGSDTGTVTYAIATGGSASGCSVSSNVLTVTSVGTCKLVATKATTLNYLITYSDTATITFSRIVSRPLQVQLYPSMIPLNQGNALETTTLTVTTLTITSVTGSGGNYTVTGTGFNNVSSIRIGGTDLVLNTNYTVGVGATSISITNTAGLSGPLFISLADGQLAVRFRIPD